MRSIMLLSIITFTLVFCSEVSAEKFDKKKMYKLLYKKDKLLFCLFKAVEEADREGLNSFEARTSILITAFAGENKKQAKRLARFCFYILKIGNKEWRGMALGALAYDQTINTFTRKQVKKLIRVMEKDPERINRTTAIFILRFCKNNQELILSGLMRAVDKGDSVFIYAVIHSLFLFFQRNLEKREEILTKMSEMLEERDEDVRSYVIQGAKEAMNTQTQDSLWPLYEKILELKEDDPDDHVRTEAEKFLKKWNVLWGVK